MRSASIIACVFGFVLCSCNTRRMDAHPGTYSMCRNLVERDGGRVVVDGFLTIEVENDALYPDKASASRGATHDALWVEIYRPIGAWTQDEYRKLEEAERSLKEIAGNRVRMTGRVDLSNRGHLGAYCGALEMVEVVAILPGTLVEDVAE